MYAIHVEDKLSESIRILDTLGTDETAAMLIMIANAEIWVAQQPVQLGFSVVQDERSLHVNVLAAERIVLEQIAWPIHHVQGSGDAGKYIKHDGGLH